MQVLHSTGFVEPVVVQFMPLRHLKQEKQKKGKGYEDTHNVCVCEGLFRSVGTLYLPGTGGSARERGKHISQFDCLPMPSRFSTVCSCNRWCVAHPWAPNSELCREPQASCAESSLTCILLCGYVFFASSPTQQEHWYRVSGDLP